MHPAWLRCEISEYARYSCVFAPCQMGASTPKIVNLVFREPYYRMRNAVEVNYGGVMLMRKNIENRLYRINQRK